MNAIKKRPTMSDVGRTANVSLKTVSRVFNGERYVSEEIRRRVVEAAKKLNYHPNMLAQALVRQRSNLVGLVYENPSPSYVSELQRGVLDGLQGSRYRLIVIPIQSVEQNGRNLVGHLRSAALDAVVLAPPASDHLKILDELQLAGIKFARIAPTREIEIAPSIVIDDVGAAREIAEYILSLGHRDIAIIKGDPTHPSSQARMTGYLDAFAAVKLDIKPHRIAAGLFTLESGREAARKLLSGASRPSAILAQNDDMAVGALMAARELGLRAPEDISVAGFDDSEIARVSWPPLTTVRQPVFDMARSAASMLTAQLDGTEFQSVAHHSHQLVIRESVRKY